MGVEAAPLDGDAILERNKFGTCQNSWTVRIIPGWAAASSWVKLQGSESGTPFEHFCIEEEIMCLTAIEVLFLIAGVWLLISGKVPNKLFQLLFGKGDYQLSPLYARLFGLLLASPLPLVFGVAFALAVISNQNQLGFSIGFEIVYDFVVAIIAIIIARKSRQSTPQRESPNNKPGQGLFPI